MSWLQTAAHAGRKQKIRFLKMLAVPSAHLIRANTRNPVSWAVQRTGTADQPAGGSARWSQEMVAEAMSAGILDRLDKDTCCLSAAGKMTLRRALSGGGDFEAQHRDRQTARLPSGLCSEPGQPAQLVTVNLNESPLARLAVRRTRTGAPLLGPDEVQAGERLRADYTFAALMPNVQPGWQTEKRSGTASNRTGRDLTDDVLAARKRVTAALAGLQPELAGVLVDICCHLKGLETVETERMWPSRSAKIVLKIALSALASNYREARPQIRTRPQTRHF